MASAAARHDSTLLGTAAGVARPEPPPLRWMTWLRRRRSGEGRVERPPPPASVLHDRRMASPRAGEVHGGIGPTLNPSARCCHHSTPRRGSATRAARCRPRPERVNRPASTSAIASIPLRTRPACHRPSGVMAALQPVRGEDAEGNGPPRRPPGPSARRAGASRPERRAGSCRAAPGPQTFARGAPTGPSTPRLERHPATKRAGRHRPRPPTWHPSPSPWRVPRPWLVSGLTPGGSAQVALLDLTTASPAHWPAVRPTKSATNGVAGPAQHLAGVVVLFRSTPPVERHGDAIPSLAASSMSW